eukprot:5554981-Prymnesium_polylepis.2
MRRKRTCTLRRQQLKALSSMSLLSTAGTAAGSSRRTQSSLASGTMWCTLALSLATVALPKAAACKAKHVACSPLRSRRHSSLTLSRATRGSRWGTQRSGTPSRPRSARHSTPKAAVWWCNTSCSLRKVRSLAQAERWRPIANKSRGSQSPTGVGRGMKTPVARLQDSRAVAPI